MEARQLIKELLKESGITMEVLSKLMGYNSKSTISEMLRINAGVKCGNLYRIADLLGYEVIVRKKKPGKLENGYRRLSFEESAAEETK